MIFIFVAQMRVKTKYVDFLAKRTAYIHHKMRAQNGWSDKII